MSANTFAEPSLPWLWQTTWQAAVLVLLILLAQWLLRNRLSPRWRCAMWGLLLIRLAMPVLPESRLSLFNLPPPSAEAAKAILPDRYVFVGAGPLAAPPSDTHAPKPVMTASTRLNWRTGALFVWLAGMLFVAARFVGATFRFSRLVRRMRDVEDETLLKDFDACCRAIGVRHRPRIVETNRVHVPALYGVLRPVILLPAGLMHRLSPRERRFVLCHELVHLKRHDVLAGAIMWLFNAIHWFNPVLWYAAARFRADRELACDARVLAMGREEDRLAYGETILKLVESIACPARIPGAAAIVEGHRSLERRIARIVEPVSGARGRSLVALLLMLGIASIALTQATRGQATQPGELVMQVYDVQDLLINVTDFTPQRMDMDEDGWPIAQTPPGQPNPGEMMGRVEVAPPATQPGRQELVDSLIEQIRNEVAPASWAGDGDDAPGIRELSGQLLIRQTPTVHQQIRDFLAPIREARSVQVTVETRFLTGEFGLDPNRWVNADDHQRWPVLLGEDEVSALLRIVQQDLGTTILTAPRLTLFDRQRAFVVVATDTSYIAELRRRPATQGAGEVQPGEVQPGELEPVIRTIGSGVVLNVRPTVSPDRTAVEMEIRPRLRRLLSLEPLAVEGPPNSFIQVPTRTVLRLDTVANIPSGQTLLMRVTPQVQPPPVGAPAPAEPPLYILVKPNVIVHREAAEPQAAPFDNPPTTR